MLLDKKPQFLFNIIRKFLGMPGTSQSINSFIISSIWVQDYFSYQTIAILTIEQSFSHFFTKIKKPRTDIFILDEEKTEEFHLS